MSPMAPPRPVRNAALVASMVALDPAGLGGVLIRASFGPARDAFLDRLRHLLPDAAPMRRMPLSITDDRLLGGTDLAATLRAGRRVAASGLLAEVNSGIVIVPMAERLDRGLCGKLVAAQEQCRVITARDGIDAARETRFGIVALDEGIAPDETPPAALADRLAFMIDPDDLAADTPWPDRRRIARARVKLAAVSVDEALAGALSNTAASLGISSLRAVILALRATRVSAALAGRTTAIEADAICAAQLVLSHRATQLPPPAEPPPPENAPQDAPEQPDNDERAQSPEDQALDDRVLDAARSALPRDLLSALAMSMAPPRGGAAGGKQPAGTGARRGRPAGVRSGTPGRGARLALIDTLRAAAPMQALRRRERPDHPAQIIVRGEDFRIKRFIEPVRSVTIFAVDASGSAALNRLAEAKGALLLLLADCYVRRDQVALIAFRNRGAELLLAPTSALARARRSLAALPGGGATPLAIGIDQARDLAGAERRRGNQPLIVVLTDGGANIGRDGKPGRQAAGTDALDAARACATDGLAALLIDTAPRPNAFAAEIARAMAARYLPLPFADAAMVQRAVQAGQRR